MRSLLLLLTVALLTVPASPAAAHKPVDASGATTVVPDATTSYAYYRDLPAGESQRYVVEIDEPRSLHIGVSLPLTRDASPGVDVVVEGPGLPAGGARLEPTDRGEFFEPFTQTRYSLRQGEDLALPVAGTYVIVVSGAPGKYVLDTGTVERFGPVDLLRMPVWWVEVNAYFGHWGRLAVAALLVAGAAVALIRRRSARRSVAGRLRRPGAGVPPDRGPLVGAGAPG